MINLLVGLRGSLLLPKHAVNRYNYHDDYYMETCICVPMYTLATGVLISMRRVRGLQNYIAKHTTARNKLDLATLKECSKQSSEPLLLCDYLPVVEFVLSAYDVHLVKTGRLSPYALLYGGDL